MFTKEGLIERFKYPLSDQLVNTVNLAQKEAEGFMHHYIGTEHLLLALSQSHVPTLDLLGIPTPGGKIRNAVEFIIGRGDQIVTGEPGFTPRAEKVIELSEGVRKTMGDSEILNDHLLVGLVKEGEGIAAGILESLGANRENLLSAVIKSRRIVPHALHTLSRLQAFVDDPEQNMLLKQQLNMVLDGALGLTLHSQYQKNS